MNVSKLHDGQLTFSVTVTDQVGNQGNPSPAVTATLDTTAPSGYTLSGVPSLIDLDNESNVGFTINSSAGRRQR